MPVQKYQLHLVPPDLRPEEMYLQIADALEHLEAITEDIFARVSSRVENYRARVSNIADRARTAQAQIDKIRGSSKAIRVFSSYKYPGPEVLEDYTSFLANGPELVPPVRTPYKVHSRHVGPDEATLKEKLQFNTLHPAERIRAPAGLGEEGLGRLPRHLESVSTLLLFNTAENPGCIECIEFCVKLQILATETFEMLNKAFPNDAPKKTTVFEWHSRFKAGRISIEDAPQNPRTTLLELEQDTGISKTTIGKIVTEDLKFKKTPAKCIPRFLTNEQNLCRLATCEDMFKMTRTDPEWKDKIITGDETWVYGYDPETKRQSAEWRGQGQTVIKEMYLSILRRLREAIRKKRPEKWTNGDWILHHDNARPHTAHLVTSFLAKNGTEILPQPPYSPDIAPNDFFLFPKLKAVLKGRHFDTREDIIEKSLLALKRIPKEAYKNYFDNWEKRWRWYKKYVTLDPLGAVTRTRQEMRTEQQLDEAPVTISTRQTDHQLEKHLFYSPELGQVPEMDVPLALPDLPGIADDLLYSAVDLDSSIAPSLLPEITSSLPELPTVAKAPPPPPPPVVEVPDGPPAPPVAAPPPVKAASKLPEAVSNPGSARADLLQSIRQAGGKAKLKSVSDRKLEAKKQKQEERQQGGDLMADLLSKLQNRRKGISGRLPLYSILLKITEAILALTFSNSPASMFPGNKASS
ncbi:hypothetical protein LAZ67_7000533 [Cordylochernes scorpioides]|uniref:WH2 domain-containing protein n=1 Tax=Cordylochernes scorpioides TaxID=51811 RepID=A0ABY6KPH5_9ARAC|nr:hypothetical protein LAZ67_7000533 [Cordylochernes scorpioides]